MNTSGIRVLAERASSLEDRSVERVGEIHGRVAEARRQRRIAAGVGAAAVAILAAISLVAVTSGGGDEAPVPAPEPTSITPPERGDCWAVPATAAVDQDHWFDDSPQVPCTEEHTTETVLSYPLVEGTLEAGEEYVDRCREAVRSYLGVDEASWIPWGFMIVGPSEQQVEGGAAWARCDAVFPTTWNFDGARTMTRSALAVADDRAAEFWACLGQPPAEFDQPFVRCDQPHAYEQTGTLAMITGSRGYPSAVERDRATRTQCERAVPESLSGVSVTAVWDPRSAYEPYGAVAGVCFVFDPAGSSLPAR